MSKITTEQIETVSSWMEEYGIDPHLIYRFKNDFMKPNMMIYETAETLLSIPNESDGKTRESTAHILHINMQEWTS